MSSTIFETALQRFFLWIKQLMPRNRTVIINKPRNRNIIITKPTIAGGGGGTPPTKLTGQPYGLLWMITQP